MCNDKRQHFYNKIVVFLIFSVMNVSSADWVEVSHFTMPPEGGRKAIPSVFQSSLLTKSSFLNHVLAKDGSENDEVTMMRDGPEMKMQPTTSLIITRKDLERRAQLSKLEDGFQVDYNPTRGNHSLVENGEDDDDGVLIEDDDIDDERGPYVETADEVEETTAKPKQQPKPQPQQEQPKSYESLSFSGFVSFLKNIQNSMVFRAARGINDKIQILTSFKNKLLMNIVERMKHLWSDKPRRAKRGLMSGGHDTGLDFPSAEGALMTISFLTFAVFLIKLVLQVINTIKSKHYSYNGFDTSQITNMKIVKKHRNARKLSISDEDDIERVVKATRKRQLAP